MSFDKEPPTAASCGQYCMHGGTCKLISSIDGMLDMLDFEYLWDDLSNLVTCECPRQFEGRRCEYIEIGFANKDDVGNGSKRDLVAGVVATAFLLIMACVIGVIVWRRRRFVNREKRQNNQLRHRQQNRTTIEGLSVVDDGSLQKIRCVTSISSQESRKNSNPSYTPEINSRLPYGPIKYRVEAPHMKRNQSALSTQDMKRMVHNKDDFIEEAERNNNRKRMNNNNEKSKMATTASAPQMSSLEMQCEM